MRPFINSLPERISRAPAWALTLLLASAATLAALEPWSRLSAGQGRPAAPAGIILITVDTLRADRLEAYGYAGTPNPAVNALAEDGVLFEQVIAQSPLTLPSHCSILTGSFPYHTGVRDQAGFSLKPHHLTLAERLRSEGYGTAAFIGSSVLNAGTGLDQGFDLYWDLPEQGLPERLGGEVMSRALDWLSSRGDGKFFAWIHLFDPHAPYAAPEPFGSRYRSRPYDGEVAYVDSLVGDLVRHLKRLRLYDRTLLVFTSDHGESLGEHGESSHGMFLYDATVRIPLIIKAAGSPWKGRRIREQVRGVDIAPTILQLAGLRVDDEIQGRGLLSLIRGRWNQPELPAYSETYYPYYHFQWSPLFSMRARGFKYIDAPNPELYDLVADAGERRNIIGGRPSMAAYLKENLEDEYRKFSAGRDEPPEPEQMDRATIERLKSLGYLGFASGTAKLPSTEGLADPKDRIALYELLQQAFQDSEEGRFIESNSKLRKVVAQEEGLIDAHLYLGLNSVEMGQFSDAIEAFQAVLRRDPGNLMALYNLALSYLNQGRPDAAVPGLERTVQLDPDDVTARVALGRAYQLAGRLDDAIDALEKAVAARPEFADALDFLSQAYGQKGWTAKADSARRRAEAARNR